MGAHVGPANLGWALEASAGAASDCAVRTILTNHDVLGGVAQVRRFAYNAMLAHFKEPGVKWSKRAG
jgi:hypothetical protein